MIPEYQLQREQMNEITDFEYRTPFGKDSCTEDNLFYTLDPKLKDNYHTHEDRKYKISEAQKPRRINQFTPEPKEIKTLEEITNEQYWNNLREDYKNRK